MFARTIKRLSNRHPLLPLIVVIVFVALIAVFLFTTVLKNDADVTKNNVEDTRVAIDKPLAEQKITKEFKFPLKDQDGKEVNKFTYEIENAELRNEIIVKGERATAIKGRTFLVVNIKITNNYSQSIQLNVRDFIRLNVNKSDDKLAPDIHNDPVDVQAISTKYTRVGFPINDTDTDLTLLIGEIEGKKEEIKLKLQ